jgi:D-Tyr-tRNAtyr deacylase
MASLVVIDFTLASRLRSGHRNSADRDHPRHRVTNFFNRINRTIQEQAGKTS